MAKQVRGIIALLVMATIWGGAFVVQKVGSDYLPPFAFNMMRAGIGAVALGLVMLVMQRSKDAERPAGADIGHVTPETTIIRTQNSTYWRDALMGGFVAGIVLTCGMAFLQIGIMYTTASKGGFITALYIVLVPLGGLLLGRRVTRNQWLAVILGTVGLYLLSFPGNGNFQIGYGDFITLLGALSYAIHIYVIDYYSQKVDSTLLSWMQIAVSAVLSGIIMLLFENPDWSLLPYAIKPLLYVGVMSTAIGFTCQVYGQKYTDPTTASLIMSLESVFALLFGILFLAERLSMREFVGAAIMFTAIILSQVRIKRRAASQGQVSPTKS